MVMTKKKKITIIVAAVMVFIILLTTILCCVLLLDESYRVDLDSVIRDDNLVFSDEFDGAALNENILIDGKRVNRDVWNITDVHADPVTEKTTGIRRGAYWDMSQVAVKDGELVITTEKKDDGKYYTAGLTTAGNKKDKAVGFEQKYGYFEIKCQLPPGEGLWSAFWMMSDEFPQGGKHDAATTGAEIDIFEAPCNNKGMVQQAVHKGGYGDNHSSTFNPRWIMEKHGDLHESMHTYGLYWNEEIYKFYVDRKCVWTTSFDHNVSQVPQWLFVSIEIGGQAQFISPNGTVIALDDKGVPTDPNGTWQPVIGANPWVFVGGKSPENNPPGWKSEFKIDYVKSWNALPITK